jgi:membrane-bound lytic murein transglycosylase
MAAPAVGAPAVAGQEVPMSPEELMEITQLLKGILPKLEGIISTNAPQQPQQPQSMDGKDMPNPGVDPLEKDVKGTENENDAVLEKKLSKAADEAVKRAVSDASEKNALVERVSRVVGVFDHAEMDLNAVAKYGVEKIGIKCQDGLEKVALDGYFAGIAAASQHSPTRSLAGDAGEGGEVSAYLASLKK